MTFDSEVARGGQRTSPQRRRPNDAGSRHSSVQERMLAVQRSAGNAAVAQAVGPTPAQQPAAAASQATGSMALQLGAMWNVLVVLPLARASERLSRDVPDFDRASPDLDEGLRGVRLIKGATPADDRNYIRIEILERRVEGLRDFVEERRGNVRALEKDMIRYRVEAAELGPDLKYPPNFGDAGTTETSEAKATAPGSAEKKPASAADTSEPAEGVPMTILEYWKQAVVARMWEAQREARDSPILAAISYRLASANIIRFLIGTPEGEPTRLRLLKLSDGLDNLLPILDSRAGSDLLSVADQAIDAYVTAETVGKYLTGQPVEDEEATEGLALTEPSEPSFTWERELEPFKNDSDLERP